MEEKNYQAKTLDEAITNACVDLSVTSDMLEYTVVQEGSKGFFGFLAKDFIIKAKRKSSASTKPVKEKKEAAKEQSRDNSKGPKESVKRDNRDHSNEDKPQKGNFEKKDRPAKHNDNNSNANNGNSGNNNGNNRQQGRNGSNQPKKQAPVKGNAPEQKKDVKPAAAVKENAEMTAAKQPERSADKAEKSEKRIDRPVVLSEDPVKRAEEFLTGLFGSMDMKIDYKGEYLKETNELAIDLSGEDMGVLIGKRGQTLDALQYLISQVVNKHQSSYIRVKLDTENYRERRKETMETLAQNIAQKVKRTRKPVALEPMNPYERRIIHSVLQADKEVITRSEGEEPYRHVVVCPARRRK